LSDWLTELDKLNFEMPLTGFTAKEIEDIIAPFRTMPECLTDPDAVPDTPKEPKTKRGELWLLDPYFECESCKKRYSYEDGKQMTECPCG
jgi:hypothetical protein